MPLDQKDRIEFAFKFLAIVGPIIAFIFTLRTWKDQTRQTRAEFLESRIKEFKDSSMFLAKAILDSFAVSFDSTATRSDVQIVTDASSKYSVHPDIQYKNLDTNLIHSLPDTVNSRQRIRVSFDNLLDFFGKLDYYLRLGLMKRDEISYFNYYLEQCAASPAIMTYAERYKFDGFSALVKAMVLLNKKD